MLALIGIIYVILPMLATPLLIIGLFIDKKNIKFYFFGLVLNLALIGYYNTPDEMKDLYQHFLTMESLKNLPIELAINQNGTSSLFVMNIAFYLIAQTNNFNILPFLAIMITYFIIIKDIIYFGRKFGISNALTCSLAIGVIVWWALIWPMSGVRTSVVLALFFHGLFREFVMEKKNWKTYLFYFIPCLIHFAPIVLVFLRLLVSLYNKVSSKLIIILLFVWSLLLNQIVLLLSNVNLPYISGVISKITHYDDYTTSSQYYITTNLIKLLFCIVLVICYYILKSKGNKIFIKYKKLYDFGLLLSIFCISGLNTFIILDRYGYLVLAMLPLFIMPLMKYSKSKYLKSYLVLLYPVFLIIGIYINYVPLKGTTYSLTIYEFLSKNIVDLFIR